MSTQFRKHYSPGYIYIASNKSLQTGLYKIGYSNNPERRMKELTEQGSTALPMPYVLEFMHKTSNMAKSESLVHQRLHSYRINKSREFFLVDFNLAKNTIIELCINDENHISIQPEEIRSQIKKLWLERKEIQTQIEYLHGKADSTKREISTEFSEKKRNATADGQKKSFRKRAAMKAIITAIAIYLVFFLTEDIKINFFMVSIFMLAVTTWAYDYIDNNYMLSKTDKKYICEIEDLEKSKYIKIQEIVNSRKKELNLQNDLIRRNQFTLEKKLTDAGLSPMFKQNRGKKREKDLFD